MDYMQQIGKAAKLLDLKGDVAGAIAALEAVVNHSGIGDAIPEHVEALTFLAEIHAVTGDLSATRRYIAQVEALDLTAVEPDLVQHHLDRIRELNAQL